MIQSLEGMDLTDRIREMSGRFAKRLNSIKTEEATKTALVLPWCFFREVLLKAEDFRPKAA